MPSMEKLRYFGPFFIVIIAVISTVKGQESACPIEQDKAAAHGQVCDHSRDCTPDTGCGGKRACSCDGFCGYKCIRVLRNPYCLEELQAPHHAQLDYDSDKHQVFNTTATYTCDPGSVLIRGNLTRTCRGDGIWSGFEPQCYNEEEDCPRKEDAIINNNRECQPSCSLRGNQCNAPEQCVCDGVCGMTCVPIAQENYCEPHPVVDHVSTTFEPVENRQFGTIAKSSCEAGYEKVSGDESRTCGGDGLWSGGDLACNRSISCLANSRPVVENTNIEDDKEVYKPGEFLVYSCNYGYYRIGLAFILCKDDGLWQEPELTCRLKSCPTPPIPENGGRRGSVFSFGSTVTITCNTGYRMIGLPYRTCQGDQVWSGYEPECKPVECPKLYPPANGIIFPEERYTYQTRVEVECDDGFIHDGSITRQCQANREWSGEPFSCRAINCGDPGTPANGQKLGQDYSHGAIVYFTCSDNFELRGSRSTRCTDTEEWTMPIPQCRGFCLVPEQPTHGWYPYAREGSRIEDGDVVQFRCPSGYELSSDEPWTCDGGDWSFEPECIELPCSKFQRIASTHYNYDNPIRDGREYEAGTTVTVTCNNDYQLTASGVASVICVQGEWQDQNRLASCIPRPCVKLPNPSNGYVYYNKTTSTSTVPHYTAAFYDCTQGYEILVPYETQVCQFGQWNHMEELECQPAPCDTFQLPNGTVTYSTEADSSGRHPHLSTAQFSQCDPGNVISGDGINTCNYGRWYSGSGPASTCRPQACQHAKPRNSKVKYFLNGQEIITTEPYQNMRRRYTCLEGFTKHPPQDVDGLCTHGTWNQPPPSCTGTPCSPYRESPTYTTFYHPSTLVDWKYPHGTKLQIVCVEGRELTVPGGITTCEAGEWEHSIECESHNIALGKDTKQSSEVQGYSPASRAVDGNPSMVLSDNSCTHTSVEVSPWWQVDLETFYSIRKVTLVNTDDRCCKKRLVGAVVRVGRQWTDPPTFTDHVQCGDEVFLNEAKNGVAITRTCNTNPIGRYVSVQLVGKTQRLQLCEVLVFGDAATGCMVPSIINGQVNIGVSSSSAVLKPNDFVNSGTHIYFNCNEGYDRSPENSYFNFCNQNGYYDRYNPTCQPGSCSVRWLNNGWRRNSEIRHGDYVDYSCHNGYVKITDQAIRCETGSLIPMEHACVRPQCTIPPLPAHLIPKGQYPDNKVKHGHYFYFTCEIGYRLEKPHHTFLYCNAGRLPTGGIGNTCLPEPCSPPGDPGHGTFQLSRGTGYFQDSIITLECDEGYRVKNKTESSTAESSVEESSIAKCREGHWTSLPTCEIDLPATGRSCEYPQLDCGLRIFMNGREIQFHESQWIPHRSSIVLAYSQSYVTSLCNDGNWAPEVEACGTTCQRPPISAASHPLTVFQTVIGGDILTESSPAEFPLGTVIEARCGDIGKARLIPAESVRRECTSLGWGSGHPTCEKVGTELLFREAKNVRQLSSNGTVVVQEGFGELKIQCDVYFRPGQQNPVISGPYQNYRSKSYNTFGDIHTYYLGIPRRHHSGRYTCRHYDEQHFVEIRVRDMRCPEPGVLEKGRRQGTNYNINQKVRFSCLEGFQLYGEATITCTLRGWSAPTPTCRVPGCPALTAPSNVTVTGGGTSYGSIRLFTCLEGYTTVNGITDVSSECGLDGQWTNQPPICSVKKTAAVTTAPAVDPCVVSNPCEDWQTCIGVNSAAMCFCKHPKDCPYSKDPQICGTDGKNYTSLCNLKTVACFFDRVVEKELDTPCPPVVVGAFDEYSLYSADDEYSLDYEDEKATTTTIPFTNGSIGLHGLPPSIQPDEGSEQFQPQPVLNEGSEQDQPQPVVNEGSKQDRLQPIINEGSEQFQPTPTVDERSEQTPSTLAVPVGCSVGCEMMSLAQACQNATLAFVAKMSNLFTVDRGVYSLEIGQMYWGNVTTNLLTILVSPLNNNNNNNCFCPHFDISDKDHIIISQSQIEEGSTLHITDYVALADGHISLSQINECAKHFESGTVQTV